MNRIKFLIGIAIVAMTLAACNKEDNPVESSPTLNLDDPQEQVTDQPANAPQR